MLILSWIAELQKDDKNFSTKWSLYNKILNACLMIKEQEEKEPVANKVKLLSTTVFPSEKKTVAVHDYDNEYGGAHKYTFINSLGYRNGKSKYDDSVQTIQFAKLDHDGTVTPGVQDEQLIIAMIDRHEKFQKLYPSEENVQIIILLYNILNLKRKRIEDRIERDVMGELKK